MRARSARRSAKALLVVLALGVVVWAPLEAAPASASNVPVLPSGCAQATSIGTVSCTYSSTGAEQTFVVPDGVTQFTVNATGSSGGDGQSLYRGAISGGAGATASGVLDVTSGATLYIEVGNSAGFNGGGSGVRASVPTPNSTGSGGGASDVRTISGADAGTLASRLLVAGGGGGGGGEGYTLGFTADTPLGGAGGAAGQGGNDGGAQAPYAAGTGGQPGIDSAGGAAGTDSAGGQTAGQGVLGSGGSGASYGNGVPYQNYGGGGGGGGGGWYGGGGGGAGFGYVAASGGGGGAGGSSHVPAGGTIGTAALGTAPSVVITYQPAGAATYLEENLSASTVTAGGAVAVQTIGVNARGEGVDDLSSSAQLSISPDGSCSGTSCTPAEPGDHIITAVVGTLSATADLTATIASPVFTQDSPTVTTAVVNDSYSYTFAATGLPTPTFSIGSGSLPPGLTLDPDSGLLSGTLTTVGVSTFTVIASNGGTAATSPQITITVTLAAGCSQPLLAGVVTCVFDSTGAEQTFAVPSGVTSLDVTAVGAAGGAGAPSYDGAWSGGAGGSGGEATASVTVTPSSTLLVEVGGVGSSGSVFGASDGAFNGGGMVEFGGGGGGGGGGASDVRTIAASAGTASLNSRLVVAGGGGGGGAAVASAFNGNGGAGGAAGSQGQTGQGLPFGGGPGGSTAGGAGGFQPPASSGESGVLGIGGSSVFTGGGSGGGGLYGGGSGAGTYASFLSATGGGGGSTWVPNGTTGIATGLPPSVTISYQPPLTLTTTSSTVQISTGLQFSVTGQDSSGAAVDVSASAVLMISPDGTCVGTVCTPNDAGQHTVTATLRNLTARSTFDAVSTPAPVPTPLITTASLPDGTVGTAYSSPVVASGTPAPTFTVSAGVLPAGLRLDASTGVVSGTPTAAGPASFTVTATNTAGSDSQAYTVTVAAATIAPLITSTSTTLVGAVVGTAYSATIKASGTGPITFTVTTGVLPAGLRLDASTGVVSGTPTAAGPASFTVTATNTAGSDSQAYTVIVAAAAPGLPFTGFDAAPWGVGGVLTLLAGAVLLILAAQRRWRRRTA